LTLHVARYSARLCLAAFVLLAVFVHFILTVEICQDLIFGSLVTD